MIHCVMLQLIHPDFFYCCFVFLFFINLSLFLSFRILFSFKFHLTLRGDVASTESGHTGRDKKMNRTGMQDVKSIKCQF